MAKGKHTGGRPKVMDDRVKRTVYFDRAMWDRLYAYALETEKSVSEIIRTAVEDHLRE